MFSSWQRGGEWQQSGGGGQQRPRRPLAQTACGCMASPCERRYFCESAMAATQKSTPTACNSSLLLSVVSVSEIADVLPPLFTDSR